MAMDNSVGAVIVAAGRSSRMAGVDKIFAPLGGRPLLAHTLDRFEEFAPVGAIALVLAAEAVERGRELVRRYQYRKVTQVCAGGERRQDSVRAGLAALPPCQWVIIHDGARPGVDAALLQRGMDAAKQSPDGAAIAAVPVKDTIKVVSPALEITDTPDRSTLYAAQTPQIFRYDRLVQAHAQFAGEATDDAAIVESLGDRVTVFIGSYRNLKVTTPEDLAVVAGWVGVEGAELGNANSIKGRRRLTLTPGINSVGLLYWGLNFRPEDKAVPRHTEPNANTVLGNLLQPMLGKAVARAQNSGVIVDQPLLQPDILITAPGRSPVVVEAEYRPAANVEQEAKDRLGLEVTAGRRRIEAVIALRYPEEVSDAAELAPAIQEASLSYCVFTVAKYSPPPERKIKSIDRFPESGWLYGSLSDLAELIRLVSIPQLAVDAAADALEKGIGLAAEILNELEKVQPAINPKIASLLGMDNVPQTRRMAGAIIANAMVFHHRVAGIHPDIKALSQVCGPGIRIPQEETLAAWGKILAINYWPIFAIGRDILREIPAHEATRILQDLYYIVAEVNSVDIDHARNLTGRVFQRLIADRKYLATYYTRPESAALLARLAVAKLEGIDWQSPEAVSQLRIADFACGTGALLSAVYDQIAARHERAGGDPEAIHSAVMEESLYGFDVMPSAVHITSATLSGAQPNVGFGKSCLYTMPYGRLDYESVAIGSLEFLTSNAQFTLSNFSDPVLRTNGNGDERAHQAIAELPESGFDLVIMNPPFTRNTTNEGVHSGQFNAAFAAFDTSESDQRAMSRRLDSLKRETCYHGNAGIASAFAALGDRKLKPGGVLALVLPLSVAAGLSWQGFRQLLADDYDDLTVLCIAANGRDMSFSSDTGMAECLVVARKGSTTSGEKRNRFVSLRQRPRDLAQSSEIAKSIATRENIRQIEDGPYGGTPLPVGDSVCGEMLTARQSADGGKWGSVRILDYELAQTAYALAQSQLWLPGSSQSLKMDSTELGIIAGMGLHHRDITGPAPRGPFNKVASSPTATYPSLWNHQARNETRIVCAPDSRLQVRRGMEKKADEVWATASRAHVNCEFTFGSQALAVAFTERETVGGSVWPNVRFTDERFDYAFTVWSNGTLGLLNHWWHASRQQSSKVRMTIHSVESLTVLDFRALTDAQLDIAREVFEEFRDKELLPAYLADADPNRALLDKRVICDLLGFAESVYQGVRRLAAKWCAEPSVNGGKSRPKDARLII